MSSLNDLCQCFQNWAGLSDTDMAAYVRRLNSLGLISGGGGAKGPAPIIVDDAIWMLLISARTCWVAISSSPRMRARSAVVCSTQSIASSGRRAARSDPLRV